MFPTVPPGGPETVKVVLQQVRQSGRPALEGEEIYCSDVFRRLLKRIRRGFDIGTESQDKEETRTGYECFNKIEGERHGTDFEQVSEQRGRCCALSSMDSIGSS